MKLLERRTNVSSSIWIRAYNCRSFTTSTDLVKLRRKKWTKQDINIFLNRFRYSTVPTWKSHACRKHIEQHGVRDDPGASRIVYTWQKRQKNSWARVSFSAKLWKYLFAKTYFSFEYVFSPSPSSSTSCVENAMNLSRWYPLIFFEFIIWWSPFNDEWSIQLCERQTRS